MGVDESILRRSGQDRTAGATAESASVEAKRAGSSWLESELGPIHDDDSSESIDDTVDERPAGLWGPRIALALLAVAAVAWTAFYVWAAILPSGGTITPVDSVTHIVAVTPPLLLLLLLALFVQRGASAEMRRHRRASGQMEANGITLSNQVAHIRSEIEAARESIDTDIARLAELARDHAAGLTTHAAHIGEALSESRTQASELDKVAERANHNLATLRKDTPPLIDYARDLTNAIGEAGTAAIGQLRELENGWRRMEEQREVSEGGLGALKSAVETHVDELNDRIAAFDERFSDMLSQRQDDTERLKSAMTAGLDEAGERLVGHFAEADVRLAALIEGAQSASHDFTEAMDTQLAAAQQRTAALLADVSEAGQRFDESDAARAGRLREQFEQLHEGIGRVTDLREREAAELHQVIDMIDTRFEEASKRIAGLSEHGSEQAAQLAFALDASGENVRKLSDSLSANEAATEAIIQQNRQLAELLQGNSDTLENALPDSLARFAERLGEIRDSIAEQSNLTRDMENQGERLIVRFGKLDRSIAGQKDAIDELSAVSATLLDDDALIDDAHAKAEKVREAFMDALSRGIEQAGEGTAKLERKLSRLDEMTNALEARIAAAGHNFPDVQDEGFARRMALLTEALNSAAIDVAKILSTEVTDTAWQDYLKGDRGVFTRRAVRLLDSQEMKIVAEQYDWDNEFRSQVNRYIHDFEDMMRQLLSTRDGHRISVTLLSSDVGKLYVALAQAIERLRA